MAKYIDQSVAIARLTHLEVTKPTVTMTEAKRALADMFPADVVPVAHGRWVDNGIPGSILTSSFFYCPSCGAKMDGAK